MSFVGHQPPPIFKRGPAPKARLFAFVTVCLVLLVADLRFRYLEVMRDALSVVTYPVQMAAATPADFVLNASHYFATLIEVQRENADLRRQQLSSGERLLRFELLELENQHLRELLDMSRRIEVKSIAADILYNAPDPFARKVILDRGAQQGVEAGLAVVDAKGVVGQVTRVHPVQSEVTLLTDRNQSIPVSVLRNGVRGVLFGSGHGRLEMRFVLADGPHTLPVVFEGVLPDLFSAGRGAIAQGRIDASGTLVATEVLAKHDENYTPPGVHAPDAGQAGAR